MTFAANIDATGLDVIVATLLHLLVFAYWLGGDLGAFYSSFLLTDARLPAPARLAAGRIVTDVDLAPRLCLLLTAPTGLWLASLKGWLVVPAPLIGAAFAAAAGWIGLLIVMHRRHADAALRRLDAGLRLLVLGALLLVAAGAFSGALAAPKFLAVKCLLLAACLALGLMVRRAMAPFGAAYGALAAGRPTPEGDAAIRKALGTARPFVVGIWMALIAAAAIGVARPQW